MSYFIDVQGTLISDTDKTPINGAVEFIDFLNLKNIPYVVITNNTKATSSEFLKDLRNKGLNIKDGCYIDPFCVLDFILSPCQAALFGADEFKNTMQKLGYVENFKNPQAVLVASYDKFKFDEFALMIELVQNGSKFIALHETSIYKKHGKLYPGVGAIAAMIQKATACNYEVVGKPSENFYNIALKLLKTQNNTVQFKDITIISDDVIGDLLGAKKLGMRTNLVLSGKIDDIEKIKISKDNLDGIYKDIGEFLGELNAKY